MKNKKAFAFALVLLFIFSGCSSKNDSNSMGISSPQSTPAYNASASYDKEIAYEVGFIAAEDSIAGGGEIAQSKKIKTGYMSIETPDIQNAVSCIEAITQETGGYVENMEMNKYTISDREYKSYYYTLRIPAVNYDFVSKEIMNYGEVINFNDSIEDATGVYADTSARLELKTAEEKRLLEFLNNAKDINDIIALEQRLGEVRTDIEIYRDSLINIDRQVSYSTLSVNISEVDSPYVIHPVSGKLGDRMKDGFNSSVTGTVNVFQGIVVGIVYLSVPLFVAGVCVFIGLSVYKRTRRVG